MLSELLSNNQLSSKLLSANPAINKLSFTISPQIKQKEESKENTKEKKKRNKSSMNITHLKRFTSNNVNDIFVPYGKFDFFKLPIPESYKELVVKENDAPLAKSLKLKEKKNDILYINGLLSNIKKVTESHHNCIQKTCNETNKIKREWNDVKEEKESLSSLLYKYKNRVKLIQCEIEIKKNESKLYELEKLKEETEIFKSTMSELSSSIFVCCLLFSSANKSLIGEYHVSVLFRLSFTWNPLFTISSSGVSGMIDKISSFNLSLNRRPKRYSWFPIRIMTFLGRIRLITSIIY